MRVAEDMAHTLPARTAGGNRVPVVGTRRTKAPRTMVHGAFAEALVSD